MNSSGLVKAIIFTFAIALLFGCNKPDAHPVPPPPVSDVQFEGIFLLNGIEVDNPWPRLTYDNSIADSARLSIGFTEHEWIEGAYWHAWVFSASNFVIGDTTRLIAEYYPHRNRVLYGLRNMDALLCSWINDDSGYFYAEYRDSLSFYVDMEATLIDETCDPNIMEAKVKGVFTQNN